MTRVPSLRLEYTFGVRDRCQVASLTGLVLDEIDLVHLGVQPYADGPAIRSAPTRPSSPGGRSMQRTRAHQFAIPLQRVAMSWWAMRAGSSRSAAPSFAVRRGTSSSNVRSSASPLPPVIWVSTPLMHKAQAPDHVSRSAGMLKMSVSENLNQRPGLPDRRYGQVSLAGR